MRYHITIQSSNAKTGPIPVTTSSKETCPSVCPMRGFCYSASGPLNIHWLKVTREQRGDEFNTFVSKIANLPADTLGRLNQAGDLPGRGNRINGKQLNALVVANKGKRFFSYTHKLVLGNSYVAKRNRKHLKNANKNGLTINLSANNLSNADELKNLDIGPVVTLLPIDTEKVVYTPKNNKVILCPAQYIEGMTCQKCQLCQKQRGVIIGFKSHGMSKKKVSAIAKNS